MGAVRADIPPQFNGFACVKSGKLVLAEGGELSSMCETGVALALPAGHEKTLSTLEGKLIGIQGEILGKDAKGKCLFTP